MINPVSSIVSGLRGLQTHKLRSFLTMLGIIFGVAAVVAMVSIGEGAKRKAIEQIELLGINNILVTVKEVSEEKEKSEKPGGFSMGLTGEDAESIRRIVPHIRQILPQIQFGSEIDVWYGDNKAKCNVVGTMSNFPDVFKRELRDGRFFVARDIRDFERVCVIGYDLKKELFGFQRPVGNDIKVNKVWLTVIGVMEPKLMGSSEISGIKLRSFNSDLYVPMDTLRKYFRTYNLGEVDEIVLNIDDTSKIFEIATIVKNLLLKLHNGVEDFDIVVPEAVIQQQKATQRIFNIVMGCIAGISLLVGGIGIMNIMLATILERTKEIGVRRAVGAKRRDILLQFIIEASVISICGGIFGIFVGIALSKAISVFAAWETVISVPAILLAFVVSAGIGLIFGVYPAYQAARVNPIVALRYE